MKRLVFWLTIAMFLFVMLSIVSSCSTPGTPAIPNPPDSRQVANGGLGFLRTLSIIGIGAVIFFACWNSMKIYIAAIMGISTILSLTVMCMYYEKWFALIAFIGSGTALILTLISLFIKHKGIFLAWRSKNGNS